MWSQLRPRYFFQVLREIDRDTIRSPSTDFRPAITLLSAGVCLLMVQYLKLSSSFHSLLIALSILTDQAELYSELRKLPFFHLLIYTWWGWWHIVGYVLIPACVIRWLFRDNLQDYGLGLGGLRSHLRWYALLCAPILCFAVLASFRQDFASHYPFYRLAHRSWIDLIAWECIYLFQFVCLEFFFRRFILDHLFY